MSAGVAHIGAFAVPAERARAEAEFDEELYEAALQLLAGGEVTCKVSRRVPASTLPEPKRRVYAVLRRLPERWFVPPALAMQRGCIDSWHAAVDGCETPDDQILVMPRNRLYDPCKWDVAVECRPRDPADSKRFKTLQRVFGDCPPPTDIRTLEDRLTDVESRLSRLESAGGT